MMIRISLTIIIELNSNKSNSDASVRNSSPFVILFLITVYQPLLGGNYHICRSPLFGSGEDGTIHKVLHSWTVLQSTCMLDVV